MFIALLRAPSPGQESCRTFPLPPRLRNLIAAIAGLLLAVSPLPAQTSGGNNAPLPAGDIFTRPAQLGLDISALQLLANDQDPDGEPIRVTAAGPTTSQGGTVVLQGQFVVYRPPPTDPNLDQFTYSVTDARGATATAVVTMVADRLGYLPAAPSVDLLSDGALRVSGRGTPGLPYAVTISDDSPGGGWRVLAMVVADAAGAIRFTNLPPASVRSRYYRIEPPWWGQMSQLLPEAVSDAFAHAAAIVAAGGTDPGGNGQVMRLAGLLDRIYRAVGSTSVVDAAFLDLESFTGGVTTLPTLRGRTAVAQNAVATPTGLAFNGTNSRVTLHPFPHTPNPTMLTVLGGDTNPPVAGYQWAYSLCHTSAYWKGAVLMLGANGGFYYPWTHDGTGNRLSSALVSRNFDQSGLTPGVSEGAYRGQRQFRTITVSVSTNTDPVIESYVDGLLAQRDPAGNVRPTNECRLLVFGQNSDGSNPWRGLLRQWILFNRPLGSNEVVAVDEAIRVANQYLDIVIQGDSITWADSDNPGLEWPQQMWWALNQTNRVVVHDHAYSGRACNSLLRDAAQIQWHRRAIPGVARPHFMILAGVNDVIYNYGVSNTFKNLSNIWAMARSHGYVVHAMTVLPMGTNSLSYLPARAAQVDELNLLIRDCTNNPTPPFDRLWETAVLVTQPWNINQLYDGLHPTPAMKAIIGRHVGTNLVQWLD